MSNITHFRRITKASQVETLRDVFELIRHNPSGLEALKAATAWGLCTEEESKRLRAKRLAEVTNA